MKILILHCFLGCLGIFVIHDTVLYGFCYWHSERKSVGIVLILTYAVLNFVSSATTCKTVQHCCMESCRFKPYSCRSRQVQSWPLSALVGCAEVPTSWWQKKKCCAKCLTSASCCINTSWTSSTCSRTWSVRNNPLSCLVQLSVQKSCYWREQ